MTFDLVARNKEVKTFGANISNWSDWYGRFFDFLPHERNGISRHTNDGFYITAAEARKAAKAVKKYLEHPESIREDRRERTKLFYDFLMTCGGCRIR